ncbi:MAG: DUF1566 domain-containing protein [Deltaproteobacteria bacterium]|nr:DUF1566 domain-containing protein [Deltaproteobacteria bacterium]
MDAGETSGDDATVDSAGGLDAEDGGDPGDAPDGDNAAPACKTSLDCPQGTVACLANVCVGGVCQPQSLADGEPCDDDAPCTATAICQGGNCKALTLVDCDDDNVCTVDACDPQTGVCTHAATAGGEPCADNNPCTEGTVCDGKGSCAGGANACPCESIQDCAVFDDDNACNGTLFCDTSGAKGVCAIVPSSVVTCAGSLPGSCMTNVCAPLTGACVDVPVKDGAPCDDGSSCTAGETCSGGACKAATSLCQCTVNADCAPHEDGNVCNGTLYCDTAKWPYACRRNPASVVHCPKPAHACEVAACDPKTGGCAVHAAPDGTPCDDGNSKTVGDACTAGSCKPGTSVAQCTQDANCAKFEDGNFCNGTLFCNKKKGSCEINPATVKVCPTNADGPCIHAQCQPASGACKMVPRSNGAVCDADDNPCSSQDDCSSGVCKPGKSICGCYTDADCSGKQGADQYIQSMICDTATYTCKPDKVTSCDTSSDTPCRSTACDPADGQCMVTLLPVGTVCADPKTCQPKQICSQDGTCAACSGVLCDDADDCTADSCDPSLGCVHLSLDSTGTTLLSCDDGNVCSTADRCIKGNCVGVTKDCSDANACTADACDPALGCVYGTSGAATCDDGSACTIGDFCVQTVCVPGPKPADCDDGSPCTTDLCIPQAGCLYVPVFDDAWCSGQPYGRCKDGSCQAKPCPLGYEAVEVDAGGSSTTVCTAETVTWGPRPLTPKGVYQIAGETVVDTQTGLVWQREVSATTGSSADANKACDALVLGGANDWRVPTLVELQTLVDYGAADGAPRIDTTAFAKASTLALWTTTTTLNGTLAIDFATGASVPGTAAGVGSIGWRCVRTDKTIDLGKDLFGLATDGVGTVSGVAVGLLWEAEALAPTGTATAAKAYCDGLVLDGNSDWRLPNVRELVSLHTAGATGISKLFYGPGGPFHSSTSDAATGQIYMLNFAYGIDIERKLASTVGLTRCVRP